MFNFCREPGSGFRGRNLRENTFIYRFKNTLEFQCILWVPLRPKKNEILCVKWGVCSSVERGRDIALSSSTKVLYKNYSMNHLPHFLEFLF